MGERGDIIRTMQRAYTERGTAPAIIDQLIYDPATAERPLVGRVVERGLSDEYADRHFVLVEAIDGRTQLGRASCRERVWKDVLSAVVGSSIIQTNRQNILQ